MIRCLLAVVGLIVASWVGIAQPAPKPASLKFQVKIAANQVGKNPESGRVLVGIGPADGEPDFTNYRPPVLPIFGTDANGFTADKTITLDSTSDIFPLDAMEKLPAGEYTVQAIFATNRDINLPHAPGNRYCTPVKVKLDPIAGTTITLTLDKGLGAQEMVPKETATHKYLSIPSKLLSDFHGRPMVYRVGVVLPENFAKDANKKYGLIVDIGGFGTRYTHAAEIESDSRFVQIVPDGAGPYGDPYQVDSANNGPYGAALTTEVIPHIEKTFRCIGTPKSRFTTGGSTGGWVSFALQVFYPDFFNGCWSQCPDSVTFERFELINLYEDPNAYVNRFGVERPATRTIDGDTISTVRHECQLERVLGVSGKWQLSGRDWASWNATYGPKGKDGLPVPAWDGKTGAIDKSVLDHWKKYDLKLLLKNNWATLGPKLSGGKVNIWVGDADDYFLNAAVRLLKDMTDTLEKPKFDGRILIEARKGHDSGGWTRKEMLEAMAARMK
ncbi:MAG: esterase [Planctomycetes bacterium]|nr:esterase [Planctomycetota bacterium]